MGDFVKHMAFFAGNITLYALKIPRYCPLDLVKEGWSHGSAQECPAGGVMGIGLFKQAAE
jgi:hypothetical protein